MDGDSSRKPSARVYHKWCVENALHSAEPFPYPSAPNQAVWWGYGATQTALPRQSSGADPSALGKPDLDAIHQSPPRRERAGAYSPYLTLPHLP